MSDAPSPDRAGTLIARRYELLQVIGEGGHGTVWKARDRKTETDVAIKMLNLVAARDPQLIERLKREQQALVALAGTHAVGVIDLIRIAGGRLCLVMEYLEGSDLEVELDRLERRGERLSLQDLVSVLDPIVATLERAHQAGILHRDLKPANVFLLSSGGVRLLDFGLARLKRAQPLTAAGMILGSPSYIAPEVWKGSSGGLDQRVDIYSLGVIIFRCLTGRVPFEGATLQQKFLAATTAARPSLRALRPDLSSDIDDWVEEVLAIDPDHRFRSIRGAWNALLAVLGAAELAPRLVTPEDLASASRVEAPFEQPAPSIRGGLLAPSAAPPPAEPEARGAGERSVWLTPEDLQDEEPAGTQAPPPPARRPRPAFPLPPLLPPEKLVMPEIEGGFDSDFAPVPAPFAVLPADAPADDKRSFVREWLAPTNLSEPAAAPTDVVEWLGGPGKDGSTTQQLKAIRLPSEDEPAPNTQRLPETTTKTAAKKVRNQRKRKRKRNRSRRKSKK